MRKRPFSRRSLKILVSSLLHSRYAAKDVLGNGTDAHFSVGNTDWHSDSNWQRNSEKVQLAVKYHFHLDPVTAETGALRFIPGSHLLKGAEREMFQEALDKVSLESVPCQPVPTQPGDVVLFDIRTWHASLGGMPGRRVCNAEYFRNPDTTEGIEMLREIARLQSGSRNAHQFTSIRRIGWRIRTDSSQ